MFVEKKVVAYLQKKSNDFGIPQPESMWFYTMTAKFFLFLEPQHLLAVKNVNKEFPILNTKASIRWIRKLPLLQSVELEKICLNHEK